MFILLKLLLTHLLNNPILPKDVDKRITIDTQNNIKKKFLEEFQKKKPELDLSRESIFFCNFFLTLAFLRCVPYKEIPYKNIRTILTNIYPKILNPFLDETSKVALTIIHEIGEEFFSEEEKKLYSNEKQSVIDDYLTNKPYHSIIAIWIQKCWNLGIEILKYFAIVLRETDLFFSESDVIKGIDEAEMHINSTGFIFNNDWNSL